MLEIRPVGGNNNKYVEWVEIDSEKLALEGTFTKPEMEINDPESSDDSQRRPGSDDESDA